MTCWVRSASRSVLEGSSTSAASASRPGASRSRAAAVYRVTFTGRPAFGIREIKAERDGFTLTFFTSPADPVAACEPERYRLRRYHHVYQASYHSPPTDEESVHVTSAVLAPDGKSVRLMLKEPHLADRIYEVHATLPVADPAVAHYTMNRIPK